MKANVIPPHALDTPMFTEHVSNFLTHSSLNKVALTIGTTARNFFFFPGMKSILHRVLNAAFTNLLLLT